MKYEVKVKYEEKACESKKKIIKKCIRDLEKEQSKKEEDRWERKWRVVRKSRNEKGTNKKWERGMKGDAWDHFGEIRKRRKGRKISENGSRYNNNYKALIIKKKFKIFRRKKRNDTN